MLDACAPVRAAVARGYSCCGQCMEAVTHNTLNGRSGVRDTPLACAAASPLHAPCVRCLLASGAAVDVGGDSTPLERALKAKNDAVGRLLLLAGADPGLVSRDCIVPEWVSDVALGRRTCLRSVIALLGVRRFHRSPVLASPSAPVEVISLIARLVWASRGCTRDWVRSKVTVAASSRLTVADVALSLAPGWRKKKGKQRRLPPKSNLGEL